MRARAIALAGLTGVAGPGAELAYLILLDFAVGAAPIVAMVTVATFIVGAGIGAQLIHRIRRPGWVEAGLAVYSAALALGLDEAVAFAGAVLELLPSDQLTPAALALLFAIGPALGSGVTFPALVQRATDTGASYAAHTFGAALGAGAFVALLYPYAGLASVLVVIAAVHALNAVLLIRSDDFVFEPSPPGRRWPRLAQMGAGTGAFQGVWLGLAGFLFHPF